MDRKNRETENARRRNTKSSKSSRPSRKDTARIAKRQTRDEVEYRSGNSARTRKKRLSPWRVIIFIFILIAIIALIIGTVMVFKNPTALGKDSPIAVFGVKSVVVEGLSKYSEKDIVEKSQIKLGQSVFSVDKKKAAEIILKEFPYLEELQISSSSFNVIKIVVTETVGVFVLENEGRDVVISDGGKALEFLELKNEDAKLYQRIRANVTFVDEQKEAEEDEKNSETSETSTQIEKKDSVPVRTKIELGERVFDERTVNVLKAIFIKNPTKITYIDATNLASVKIRWNDQITLVLGSDFQIDHKLDTAYVVLDMTLEDKGNDARGTITIHTYSENGSGKNQAVFTPEEVEESK